MTFVQMGNYGMDQLAKIVEKENFAIHTLLGIALLVIFKILQLRLYVKDVLQDIIILNMLKTYVYKL